MALTVACERLAEIADLQCDCALPVSNEEINNVLDGASDFLSILAGTALGRCTTIYRPCRDGGCRPWKCSCCGLLGIHLPGMEPTVEAVLIDGAIISSSTYTVLINPAGQYVLERFDTDGTSLTWPYCQKLVLPATAVDTFQISVESGIAPDMLMSLAAAEIACDVFKYLAGGENLLPAGIVSAVAYGVTMNTRLPFDPGNPKAMDLAGFPWVVRFLQTVPTAGSGTEILAPELDDGWQLYQRA